MVMFSASMGALGQLVRAKHCYLVWNAYATYETHHPTASKDTKYTEVHMTLPVLR